MIATAFSIQAGIDDIRFQTQKKAEEKLEAMDRTVKLLNFFKPSIAQTMINAAVDQELGKFLNFLIDREIYHKIK